MTMIAPSPVTRLSQTLGFAILIVLSAIVAAASARFLVPDPPMAEAMQPHLEARPIVFLTHVVCGITALILGTAQFVTRLGPRRKWHAAAGRFYILAAVVGAGTGLVMAWYAIGGAISTAGFSGLAVAWFVTTAMGFREIVAGRVASHRRWMIRSFALTLAAVSLRLMLPASAVAGLDFETAYRGISFLCWVPNLIIAEIWLAGTASMRVPGLPGATASGATAVPTTRL